MRGHLLLFRAFYRFASQFSDAIPVACFQRIRRNQPGATDAQHAFQRR